MGNEIFFFFFFLSYRNHSTFLLPLMTNIRLSRIVRTQEIFFFFEMIRRNVNALNTTEENIYVSFNLMLIFFSIRDNFEYF